MTGYAVRVEAFLASRPARTSSPLHDFDGRPAGLLTLSQVAAAPGSPGS